ncbi:MAG: hypothetical protein PHI90_06060, partial [Clostridia bacterium]|nr:hypothetical protein [Clostridia bacterium]
MRIYKAFINTVICFLAFITFTFISVSFITPQKLNAQEMNISSSRLITVLIPGLSLNDLSRFPNLTHLSQASAIGLMNTRNDGARKISSAYLSISTGIRASCPESAAFGLQTNETYNKIEAQKLYERYTGNFPKSNEILVPYLNLICNTNTTEVTPGLLGHRLKENNISFSFIGNQDLPGNIMRPGVLIAMDKAGTIKQGFVGESTYIISNYSPTIYTTNYPFFIEEAAHFFDENTRLVFMDLGDLARLDSLYSNLSQQVYKTNRDKLLKEMDDFLGVLINYCQEKNIPLFLVTPFPAKEDLLKGNSLTPTIYYTGKNESKGLLYSSSTKREGILTNLDIAPSISNILGTNHQTLFRCSPITIKPHNSSLIYLEKQLDTFVRNYSQRPFIIKSYVLSLIILVLLNLFFIITSNKFLPLVSDFLLSLTSVPLFFLLLPLLDIKQVALIFLLFFGTTLATLIFLKKVTTTLHGLTFIYLVTSLFIIFDLILGSPLMKSSLLGYDPISGSRYYGLGNEYLGVLLGSSV